MPLQVGIRAIQEATLGVRFAHRNSLQVASGKRESIVDPTYVLAWCVGAASAAKTMARRLPFQKRAVK